MPRSQSNDRTYPLGAGATFTGTPESTAEHIAITVSVLVPTACTLTIEQSYNKATWLITEQYAITANVHKTVQQAVGLEYFRVKLTNDGITQTFCHLITTLSSSLTQNVNIRSLEASRDSVTVGNLPIEQLVSGENSNFEFYPTSANNTVAVYSDETKGTTVASGWQYANTITDKINWYCYASQSGATDYKVSQLTSMYTVINQQSTLGLAQAQNPWIMMYTRPTGANDSGAWYKSKLFFGSNAHTDISGVKLLYTGTDPVEVHPEITGINRIQLLFVSALSDNKQLVDVQNESIMLGSLQTTRNTTPANSFFFTMEEFGCDWVKAPAVLPIEFGKVQVGGTVGLTPALNTVTINQAVTGVNFTSTAYDMGENSLLDVLMLVTTVGTFFQGNVRLDYSPDGVTWTPNNTATFAFTVADPHATAIGIKTGSRYVRVSTGLSATLLTPNLRITFSSKRD
tara:strand:+ start:3806 stop:5176 length:1371 start_codon:yes stop_codon:yes gene_type:complete